MTLRDPPSQTWEERRAAEWNNKLVGKTLGDGPTDETTFCKADLPELTRVISPGMDMRADWMSDRMNVYLMEDGTVRRVDFG